jgi:CheY-like chemotaxis protein
VDNGLEALETVTSFVPDLVVLDLQMPGMSGQGLVESLTRRRLRSGLGIVVLSADPDVEERARLLGADGYLRKPLRLATLVREIERILDK